MSVIEATMFYEDSDIPQLFSGFVRSAGSEGNEPGEVGVDLPIEVLEGGKGKHGFVGLFVGPFLLTMDAKDARSLANALHAEAELQEARAATLGDVDDDFLDEAANN